MRYIDTNGSGDADILHVCEGIIPQPAEQQVLIKVFAAGINRPDIFQRKGLYPPPVDASSILGLEVAGEIVAVGENVSGWKNGDKVCALVNGGGYAEHAIAPAAQCLPIPDNFSFLEAAALPETFFTVWHNLFQRARLASDEILLVHGGTSGIGTTAIQLAIAFGVKVFATAGSAEKCKAIESFGAVAINYREQDFVTEIKAQTYGQGANVILDMVGGDYIQRNFSAAAKDGRIVNIAFLNGSKTELDLMPLMLKRLTFTGSTLRAQSPQVKADIAQELQQHVWPLLNQQKIKPVIDSVFPFSEVVKAHERMESSLHIGKIVLSLGASSSPQGIQRS